jgi:DNA-binding transcriptional MocR family regulator
MTTLLLDAGEDSLYVAIVKAIKRDIRAGKLPPGHRLPPHRELADELGVAVGTVTRAYAEAERQGLVRGEVGRGTFVAGPEEGASNRSVRIPQDTHGFIDLSLNYPLYADDPDLAPALLALSRRKDLRRFLEYQASEGIERHRQVGATWTAQFGVHVDPSQIVVCSGAQHGVMCAFAAVTKPGDLVATEALTYPGARGVADLLHVKLAGVALDDGGLRPDALAALCRRRKVRALYLTPTLQNPTSTTLSEERRREIVEIAREHDLWIIEDDVHRRLVLDAPPAIATLAPDRTFFVAGTSKSVSGGLRIAFLAAPPTMVGRIAQSVWATIWMVPPLCAEIVAQWIEDGTAEATVERKRAESRARQKLARHVLGGFSYRAHECGLYVWLDLPEPWTSAEFAHAVRQRGVAVTPSETFQVDAGEPPRAVRICLGAPEDRETLERALKIVASVLSSAPGVGSGVV